MRPRTSTAPPELHSLCFHIICLFLNQLTSTTASAMEGPVGATYPGGGTKPKMSWLCTGIKYKDDETCNVGTLILSNTPTDDPA